MLDKMMDKIRGRYNLIERDLGEYAHIDKAGMHVDMNSYIVEGVGYLTTITTAGRMGLTKTEAMVYTPLTVDGPLLVFEDSVSMGTANWTFDFFDVRMQPVGDFQYLEGVRAKTFDMPDAEHSSHAYDSRKMPASVSKKIKVKLYEERHEKHSVEYVSEFNRVLRHIPTCDPSEKRIVIDTFVGDLITQGSPITDQFIKMLGKEKGPEVLRQFVFSTAAEV